MPEWHRRLGGIRIDRVDAVVHGNDINNVAFTFARDLNAGGVEWLRIDLSVDRESTDLPEVVPVHIRRSQYRFLQIRVGSMIIVIPRQYADLRLREAAGCNTKYQDRLFD